MALKYNPIWKWLRSTELTTVFQLRKLTTTIKTHKKRINLFSKIYSEHKDWKDILFMYVMVTQCTKASEQKYFMPIQNFICTKIHETTQNMYFKDCSYTQNTNTGWLHFKVSLLCMYKTSEHK
jgi:hypothetical protein